MKIQISEEKLTGMIREAVVSVLKEINYGPIGRLARPMPGVRLARQVASTERSWGGKQQKPQKQASANQQKPINYTNGYPGDFRDFANKQLILHWVEVAERATGERWNRGLENYQQFIDRVWGKVPDEVKANFPPQFIPRNPQVQP